MWILNGPIIDIEKNCSQGVLFHAMACHNTCCPILYVISLIMEITQSKRETQQCLIPDLIIIVLSALQVSKLSSQREQWSHNSDFLFLG